MSGIKSYEEFNVFQRAYNVSLEIHKFTLGLPGIEQYSIADQMRRASKSICANFAEGFGKQKYSKAEFKRFILMSIGSTDEMVLWLKYAKDLGYLEEKQFEIWRTEYIEIVKMLQGLYKTQG